MEPLAHSANERGETQTLREHLEAVAAQAADFAARFGAREFGRLAGLWHDLGKVSPAFQEHLESGETGGGPDHKTAGAVVAQKAGLSAIAFAIAGHHGGLPSPSDLKERLRRALADPEVLQRAEPCAQPQDELPPPPYAAQPLSADFFVRMLFSALTDADYLDTEGHFKPEKGRLRGYNLKLEDLYGRLLNSQKRLSSHGPINEARNAVYHAALDTAHHRPGFFSLTVPTGGGKTRTAMAFALKHALKHDMDRVIVVIPYTSIIEQNADVYRRIFGTDAVLEHHTALDPDEQSKRHRLAAENWDARIVVTTSVQFFDSLHANKPSRCRKLHNVARSVVILDEVQTLPVGLTEPTLDAMRELAARYDTTFVLCTATQPAFRPREGFPGLPDMREIVTDAPDLFYDLKRVEFELRALHGGKQTWDEVAREMSERRQCLCIVNTKKDALRLYRMLPASDRFHLSSAMCPAHRLRALKDVKKRLASGRPCRLISTQVVEAGVDIDFPVVYRAFGPLDSIVQAAGRCNREGELPSGRCIVFEPEDGGMPPGAYRRAAQQTRVVAKDLDPQSLDDPELFQGYFRRLYGVSDLDEKKILRSRERLNFPHTAADYRLISARTTSVIIRDEADERMLESLRRMDGISRFALRKLQRFTVSLYPNQLQRAAEAGLVSELPGGILLWNGDYDQETGIQLEGYSPDELVV